ncbi:MAG: hypothetical protein AAB579_02165 [Patescibacteria group bacterium]
MPRLGMLSSGVVVDAIAAARVRKLLVGAQQPLIEWLGREGHWRLVVTMARIQSGVREVPELLLWLAESEHIQAVFRHIRVFMTGDTIPPEPVLDLRHEDGDRVRRALLRSISQVIGWIEDERNTAELLSVLRDIGETVNMGVIVKRLERDAGHRLAQQAFQSIRLLMPNGRPNSGFDGLAGLAARSLLI